MNKERLKQLADFLALPMLNEKGKIIPELFRHKMTHPVWNFSCVRIGKTQASELGELPTVFPDDWEINGLHGVVYKSNPDLKFWDAVREYFDLNEGDEDILFMWGDGNKKKCAKAGLLHQGATRVDVANQIAKFIGSEEYDPV